MYPRVLVISHNMFSRTENMGITLNNMFEGWDKSNIAQLSFLSELPTSDVCDKYYRITDFEALKSALTGKACGQIFNGVQHTCYAQPQSAEHNGLKSKIYNLMKKKNPFTWYCRNKAWSHSKWNSDKLNKWLDDFAPEVVFFASGDHAFSYDIALEIAQSRNIPLVTYCCDDYYINSGSANGILSRRNRIQFMNAVNKTIDYSSAVVTICDKMAVDYAALFGKKSIFTLNTNYENAERINAPKTNRISYFGNVSLGRAEQLVEIGRALLKIESENKPDYIDVYSATDDKALISLFTHDNGIEFHGKISKNKVLEIISACMAVIHTESFNVNTVKRVMYSVSTKIPDSLASGTCILAYGPKNVASIEYLAQNEAAFVITSRDELETGLKELIENEALRKNYEQNAVLLAEKNHNPESNRNLLSSLLSDVTKGAYYEGTSG